MYWLASLSLGSALAVVTAAAVDRCRATAAARTITIASTLPLFAGTASASAVGQVGTVACRLGIGDLVTFGIAALAVFHVVAGAIKATTAFDHLGSTRADRQRQGRRAMIGALQVTAGAFFPVLVGAIFTVVLDFELGACIHLV